MQTKSQQIAADVAALLRARNSLLWVTESLVASPLGEELEGICALAIEDLTGDADQVRATLEETREVLEAADAADLPRGFGQD
jgi:hypothetical protein